MKLKINLIKKIKVLRSDQSGESESPIGKFYVQHKIIHEIITPYSPQSNGVAECKNCTCDVNNFWIASEHVG